MPIKKKFLVSHGSIIVTTFILIVMLLVSMKVIEGNPVDLYEGPTWNIWYSSDLYYTQIDIQRVVNRTLAEGVEKVDEMYPQLEETINENLAINDALNNEATPHRTEVLRLIKEGDYEAALEYNDTYYKPTVDAIKVLIDDLEYSIHDVAEEYADSSERNALIMIIVGIVALVLITVMAVVIANKVTYIIAEPVKELTEASKEMYQGELAGADKIVYEPEDELGVLAESMRGTMNTLDAYVEEISETMGKIAKGDFTKNFSDITDFRGDFASIKESFVHILKEFNNTLTKIKEVSIQVDTGSDEIAGSANDLASGTGEQASAVEELTATITMVTDMAESAAKEAQGAYSSMLESVKEAQTERLQMQELQDEMAQIKQISGEIEHIITTIEQIASQTSLLALNASIEAARAGDAKANSEISKGQALSLSQVEEGIDQISIVNQQNAASSEECSAISEELAARATELANLVDSFELYSKS